MKKNQKKNQSKSIN